MKQSIALIGAMLTAIAASACCVLPTLLGVASLGTLGFGAALEPYRPALTGLTLLLLGAAFYFTYRPAPTVCDAEGNCASGNSAGLKHFNKAMLWGVALVAVTALAYPQAAQSLARTPARAKTVSAAPATTKNAVAIKTARFTIGNMTCASCTTGIAGALKKTPGVRDATVDFATKLASVRYDASRVGVAQIQAVIERAGFPVSKVHS
jgi:copper chaperone CopZ